MNINKWLLVVLGISFVGHVACQTPTIVEPCEICSDQCCDQLSLEHEKKTPILIHPTNGGEVVLSASRLISSQERFLARLVKDQQQLDLNIGLRSDKQSFVVSVPKEGLRFLSLQGSSQAFLYVLLTFGSGRKEFYLPISFTTNLLK